MAGNISPDNKWKIIIEDNKVVWIELTEDKDQYKIEELVEATKRILPYQILPWTKHTLGSTNL